MRADGYKGNTVTPPHVLAEWFGSFTRPRYEGDSADDFCGDENASYAFSVAFGDKLAVYATGNLQAIG